MSAIATLERPQVGAMSTPRADDALSQRLTGSPATENLAKVVPSSVWFGRGLRDVQVQELLAFLGAHNGVAVLQWPRDARHIEPLAKMGLPRLLLVHPSPQAPPDDDPLQAALPFSANGDDIHVNLVQLSDRAAEWRSRAGRPFLDEDGGMWVGDRCIELPPVEYGLASVLVARFGRPVDDEYLVVSGGPCSLLTDAGLRSQFTRLNRMINPLGLEVLAAAGDGHVIRWCEP